MDQNSTWYEGRPRPKPYCVRWKPSSPMERGTAAPTFAVYGCVRIDRGPCLLWPNGLVDQNATWCGGMPRRRRRCVRWRTQLLPFRRGSQYWGRGHRLGVLKRNSQNIKTCILRYRNCCIDFSQILHSDKDYQMPFVGGQTRALQIQDGGRPPSWKNRKIASNGLTDRHESWHGDAY